MIRGLLFFFLLCYTAILAGCTHQPYVIYKPAHIDSTAECDTSVITYYRDIKPILVSNCYVCHSADSILARGSGFNIEDSAMLKQYLLHDFRGDGLYGSKLYHCICHSQGALPMPPGYMLDSCSIAKISRWLHLGAVFD